MIVGYARVSTEEQKLDLQLQALEAIGCKRVYKDHGQSGSHFDRDGLEAALESLRPGGTLVVWRLDRLGRSLSGLIQLIERLGKRQIYFKSISENIDTTSSGGRLVFHLMAALAEFERAVISERTCAGLSAARARGKKLGRPRALTDEQIQCALNAMQDENGCLFDIADTLNVSTRTLRRYLRAVCP